MISLFSFYYLPAESFVSFDDSAYGWFLIILEWFQRFQRLFLYLFIMVRMRAESPLYLFYELIWGGISGITCQQVFDSIIMNWAFPDRNMGDFYGDWPLPSPWSFTTTSPSPESFSFYSSTYINKCSKIERDYFIMREMIEIQEESRHLLRR